MIQKNSVLNILDNSGARFVSCIFIPKGYRRRYAFVGDTILVSVKKLRNKRRVFSKVKKGDVVKALIVRTRTSLHSYSCEDICFFENSAILFNKKNKIIGTRLFGAIPSTFRYTRYLKLVSMAAGLLF
jgi:large subunit ribosomal protein L14